MSLFHCCITVQTYCVVFDAILAIALAMSTSIAAAGTYALLPVSDRDGGDDSGHGIIDTMRPEDGSASGTALSGYSGSPWHFALEFDLSTIPADERIDIATLYLHFETAVTSLTPEFIVNDYEINSYIGLIPFFSYPLFQPICFSTVSERNFLW